MAKKMLIDATHPEETRVVVVDGQKVEDFDFETVTKRQLAGNIYLAKVTRVEPSLQAAFVEYGGNRHGFLAFSEVHPDYYQIPVADREALLAEEAREEEERRAREDAEADAPKKSRKRGRSKAKAEKDNGAEAEAGDTVRGLEVIEVEGDDDAPNGLEVADVPEDAETPLMSLDPAGDDVIVARDPDLAEGDAPVLEAPVTEIAEAETLAGPDATPAAETPADDPATDDVVVAAADAPAEDAPGDETMDGDTADSPPRTIAESAGLDGDERVTEEIGDTGSARTVTGSDATEEITDPVPDAEAENPAPAADAAAPEADADGAEEAVAEATADTAPEAETAPETGSEAATEAPDADAANAENTAEAEADPAEATDDAEKPAKKSRRRKRSRGKAGEQETTETEDSEETNGSGEVESVGAEDTLEEAARARTHLRRKYKIQDVIKVRQVLLVQVVKEERGNKGAALTTYLSLAGRYCVLMPNTARGGGISRKITNASDRKRLREITGEMEVPQGMGLIVRTAGAERTRAEIRRDYEFLIRQWEQIRDRTLESIAPTLIYEEGSLIKRSIRDVYSKEIDQILVEGETGYREAKEYMKMLMPSHAKNVQPYTDPIPLFTRYQVESTLNGMFNPTVQLKSGGYIVIGVTEALVAIDVNSGRATKQGSIEETALQTNLEAADEVARQLKLRDLAGLIVIDFIDMDENRNNRAVEKRMKDRLKNDRARIQVGRISAFGLMEMSRQRLRPGMLEATTQPCPHCMGTGLIRSDENMSLSILREIEEEALRGRADEISVKAPVDVANYLINQKRQAIRQLEERHGITVNVLADPSLTSPKFEIERSKTSNRKPSKEPEAVSATTVGIDDAEVVTESAETSDAQGDGDGDGDGEGRSRRRRGKRGGRRRRGNGQEGDEQTSEQTAEGAEQDSPEDGEEGGRSRSRRSRGRRRRGKKDDAAEGEATEAQAGEADTPAAEDGAVIETKAAAPDAAPIAEPESEATPVAEAEPTPEPEPAAAAAAAEPEAAEEPVLETVGAEDPAPAAEPAAPEDPDKPKRRGWWSFGR